MTVLFACDPNSVIRALGRRYELRGFQTHGPAGFRIPLRDYVLGGGSVIVSQAEIEDVEWLHASVAFAEADPRYIDLVILHGAVFGRKRWAYQLFTPAADHVNIHEHALHLWGRADGKPVLPDFGTFLGSI